MIPPSPPPPPVTATLPSHSRADAEKEMNSNSLKIKLSHFEITWLGGERGRERRERGGAPGTLLRLNPRSYWHFDSPLRGRRLPADLPSSLSSSRSLPSSLSCSTASPPSGLYQDARETLRGNAGVTVAGAAGCIFFFTILFMILISPR